jgi:integrase
MHSDLLAFDRYLVKHKAGWQSLKPSFFLAFRRQLQGHPSRANCILWRIRSVIQFLIRNGDLDHNPLADVPFVAKRTFIPFIFTPEQTDRLLQTVGKRLRLTLRYYLGDLAVYTALVLIARCGMRICEPIGLKDQHFVKEDRTIYIEKTKFKKDRLIPVPSSVARQLENYLAVRKALIPEKSNPSLLIDINHMGLSTSKIYRLFHPGLKAAGIASPRQIIGDVVFGSPTVHSLRHSFAINTLKRIKARGDCVQHALPVLATYMGHCKYRYTGTYLEVLDANQRQGLIEFARMRTEL